MKTFSFSRKSQYLILTIFLGMMAIGASTSFTINHYLSFFPQGITSSTSYFIKTPLIFGFLSFCFLICFCTEFINLPKWRYPRNILFLSLLMFIFLTILGHLLFLSAFSLPLSLFDSYCFVQQGIPEVSRFSHLHIMKPLVYLLAKNASFVHQSWRFGPENFSSGPYVGTGYAFLGYIPLSFYKIAAFVYVAIFLLLLFLVIIKKQEWRSYHISLLLILFLSCFGVLENLIDGGPFSIEFFFPFLLLIFLIKLSEAADPAKTKRLIIFYASFLFIYLFLYFLIKGLVIGSYLFTLISYISLYLFPLGLGIAWKKKDKLLGFCIITALGFIFIFCQYDWGKALYQDYALFKSKILPPQKIWITTFNESLNLRIVVKDPPVRVYETCLAQEQSLLDVSRQYGLDYRIRYNPFSFLGTISCSLEPKTPGNNFNIFKGYLRLRKDVQAKIKKIKTKYWEVQIVKMPGETRDYTFSILVHKCIQPTKDMLITSLLCKALGTENFVIIK